MSHIERLLAATEHHLASRYADAASLCREVLAESPDHARALYLLGLAELASERPSEAVGLLRRAVILEPGRLVVWTNLSRSLLASGEFAGAVAAAAQACMLAPDDAAAAGAHALALIAAERPAEALPVAEHALRIAPTFPPALLARGTALADLGRHDQAEVALLQAVTVWPKHAEAHLALGNTLADLDRLDEAEAAIATALSHAPRLAEAETSLGYVLTRQGRLADAIAACERALAIRPGFVQAHWNLGIACLLAGDWPRGWALYESRKRHPRYAADFHTLPGPVLTPEALAGGDLAGRTILVFAEQGLGDTIQFARYLPLLAARGARVLLACAPTLIPLLGRIQGVVAVPRTGRLPAYDLWIDQMSLPGLFDTRPDSVPSPGGYLPADPPRIAAWNALLPQAGLDGRRIGLVWAGNPQHNNDHRRSLPPAALAALLDARGPGWVSLQLGPRRGEARIADAAPYLTDYAETAAAIANLDLLITVDTSVAHVAGALGVPCWVMLPHAPDWRWLPSRPDTTPWYDSLRLFRQTVPGDWHGVVARVIAALRRPGVPPLDPAKGEPLEP
jgi:tetratricopeptide (TPR) repeat protein